MDNSFALCFCNFVLVWLRISPPKLTASNFARWFISSLGREYPILGNFAPQKPKIERIGQPPGIKVYYTKAQHKCHARDAPFVEYGAACGRRSACVDIGQSPLMYLYAFMFSFKYCVGLT